MFPLFPETFRSRSNPARGLQCLCCQLRGVHTGRAPVHARGSLNSDRKKAALSPVTNVGQTLQWGQSMCDSVTIERNPRYLADPLQWLRTAREVTVLSWWV